MHASREDAWATIRMLFPGEKKARPGKSISIKTYVNFLNTGSQVVPGRGKHSQEGDSLAKQYFEMLCIVQEA